MRGILTGVESPDLLAGMENSSFPVLEVVKALKWVGGGACTEGFLPHLRRNADTNLRQMDSILTILGKEYLVGNMRYSEKVALSYDLLQI